MLALTVLIGMIFVGATAVIITGGYLVDSVQGSSQHELAKDNAVQTHETITEALESGESRNLGGDVDMEVLETGSIAIEMTDSSGGVCSADGDAGVDRVESDLGAIVYDTPKGAVVYQGGAVWEETEAGLSIVRAPPISYDEGTTRISIQTVSAEADSFDEGMARPNETMQTAMAKETNRMLTECPAHGYTNVEITVTSPNYAELWKQHFDEHVDTTDDVEVKRSGDTVVANISNATSAHSSRGLRFANLSAPTIVGPSGDPPDKNEFDVAAEIVNDGFESREATVELEIDGHTRTIGAFDVGTTGSVNRTVPGSGLHRNVLNGSFGLNQNEAHDYTVRLRDADGEVVDSATGRFFLEDPSDGGVSFFDDNHHFEDDGDTLVVNSTLINTDPSEAPNQLVEFRITDDGVDMPDPIPAPTDIDDAEIDVPGYGGTKGISYKINVSELGTGTYDYVLHHDDETLNRTFTIDDPPEGSGTTVGDLRVESIDPSASYVTNGSSFEVPVQLYNTASDETTAEVSLDVPSEAGLVDEQTVTIGGNARKTVTVTLDAAALAELQTRTAYDYDITVTDSDGGELTDFPGRFVFMEPGTSLQIDENTTSSVGDTRWVNVTLANHGVDGGADSVSFDLYNDDTGDLVGSHATDEIHLGSNNVTTVPLRLNASALGGTYRYEVSYGEDTVEGSFSEGDADTGDGSVSITEPGNGSVTVLGTEVSAYDSGSSSPRANVELTDGELARDESNVVWEYVWTGQRVDWGESTVVWEDTTLENDDGETVSEGVDVVWEDGELTLRNGTVVWEGNGYNVYSNDGDDNLQGDQVFFDDGSLEWGDNRWADPARKYWSPISVATVLETDGDETVHQFENDAADDEHVFDDRNLNTFDTQEETYTYNWTQTGDETTSLTVRSTLWANSVSWSNRVNTRNQDNAPQPIEDYHPQSDDVWDSRDTYINAHAGSNKEAVRVLEDGDKVPNPETSGEDQRSAKEILEANGIDVEDERLDMGPYEAIFLFELTQDSYEGMWEDASDTSGDPDYNDVIALMRFNPDDPEDVQFNVGDHSLSIGPAPDDPRSGNRTGTQEVDVIGSTEGAGDGGAPETPEPQSPDPGSPSEPDEIDVDVGGVVIG